MVLALSPRRHTECRGNSFVPPAEGTPDGLDFGVGLSQLQDGLYEVGLYAFGRPNPQTAGKGHECMTFNSSEGMTMLKAGSDLTFQQFARRYPGT